MRGYQINFDSTLSSENDVDYEADLDTRYCSFALTIRKKYALRLSKSQLSVAGTPYEVMATNLTSKALSYTQVTTYKVP